MKVRIGSSLFFGIWCVSLIVYSNNSLAATPDDYGIVDQNAELIEEDTFWSKDQIHEMSVPLFIVNGATLTIEAGATVQFIDSESYSAHSFTISDGTLIAVGTEGAPIRFIGQVDPFEVSFNNYEDVRAPSLLRYVHIGNGQDSPPDDGDVTFLKYLFGNKALADTFGPGSIRYWGGKVAIERTIFANQANTSIFNHKPVYQEDVPNDYFSVTDSNFKDINGVPTIWNENDCPLEGPCQYRTTYLHNWYGKASGPDEETFNRDPRDMEPRATEEFSSSSCTVDCFSSILFLPGIMGSRLYGEDGTELWFSSLTSRQEKMEMNSDGSSKYAVSTKATGGILEDTYGLKMYQSFLTDLSTWKTEGVYTDYAVVPYDWRLSLEDIVMNGKEEDGKLTYTTKNTDLAQSYLYKHVKTLQQNSKSGKVTLIGHSNGGLVIKAFIQKLKDTNDPLYDQIDKVIFVGVPQTGTPDTIASLLYGSKLGILWTGVSAAMTRNLGHSMPTMYNLLPSEKLFNQLEAPVEFKGDNIPSSWLSRYGNSINSYSEFEDFLTGAEGRERPDYEDLYNPEVLSENLFNQSQDVHQTLDNWTPSANTEVIQIAGWGVYTVAGLEVVDDKHCKFDPHQLVDNRPVCYAFEPATTLRDKKVLDGDETVLVKSAHTMGEDAQVKNYWVDLFRYNQENESSVTARKHKSILEVDVLRPFIKSLINNTGINFQHIADSEPGPIANQPYVKYEIHSPLHITITDNEGNKTGWDSNLDRIVENIKGAQYSEIGEIKSILIPKEIEHTVKLEAYAQGSFTLDISELEGNEVVLETKFEAIPALENTTVAVGSPTATSPAIMAIDFTNDGTIETELIVQPGETIEYENPEEQDIIAPETTIKLSGTKGKKDEYKSDVKVTLITEEGSTTGYSLDNGSWQAYTQPFIIKKKGTTLLKYRSTDSAGNQEVVKEQKIKIEYTIVGTTIEVAQKQIQQVVTIVKQAVSIVVSLLKLFK